MRAIVQRVSSASVSVDGEVFSRIGPGLVVLLAVNVDDGPDQADRMAAKVSCLRVFPDGDGRMNLAVGEVEGQILCVSQFTLYGDTARGNRPSYTRAASPEHAEPLYERVRAALGAEGGRFGAHMEVGLINDGPVTLQIDI